MNSQLVVEKIPETQTAIVILANRKAGRGGTSLKRVEGLAKELDESGFVSEVCFDIDEFQRLMTQRYEEGRLRCAIAAGGDGTAGLVSNLTPKEVPMTLFPMGTENLLAKYLISTGDISDTVEIIRDGLTCYLDIGSLADQNFLVMLSCGFDADVVRRLHRGRKGNINHFSYAKPIIGSILAYRYPKLEITCWQDASSENCEKFSAHWVFIFNAPAYAAGLPICLDASPYDGLFDVCMFSGASFWHGIYHLSSVVLRRHQRSTGFQSVQAARVRIESKEDVPFQIDGDPGGAVPVEFNLVRGGLRLLVSRKWLRDQGAEMEIINSEETN